MYLQNCFPLWKFRPWNFSQKRRYSWFFYGQMFLDFPFIRNFIKNSLLPSPLATDHYRETFQTEAIVGDNLFIIIIIRILCILSSSTNSSTYLDAIQRNLIGKYDYYRLDKSTQWIIFAVKISLAICHTNSFTNRLHDILNRQKT